MIYFKKIEEEKKINNKNKEEEKNNNNNNKNNEEEKKNINKNNEEVKKPIVVEKVENLEDAKTVMINDMREKIDIYFKIIVRNLRDLLPKIIGKFFVRNSQVEIFF